MSIILLFLNVDCIDNKLITAGGIFNLSNEFNSKYITLSF